MPLATGTKLDGYELLGLLGAGGMGEVYRARDSPLKREVATITRLKNFHRALEFGGSPINVSSDGSPIFTRDTGYQEIYALNVKWP